jgi:hypothetical protein
MPTSEEVQKRHAETLAKTGDTVRQLAFAGLALIWIFKETQATGIIILAKHLVIAGFVLILALAVDLLQAIGSALILSLSVFQIGDLKKNENDDITFPKVWILVLYILWYLKVALVAAAYFILLSYLADQFI